MEEPAASTQTSEPAAPKQSPGHQPSLIDLINTLAEKADPIVKLLKTTIEGYQSGKEREARLQKHMSRGLPSQSSSLSLA